MISSAHNPVSIDKSVSSQFPCALYHRNKEPILVRSRKEMEDAFMEGYSMSVNGISQVEVLEMKKMSLLEELREVNENLSKLRSHGQKGGDVGGDEEEDPDELPLAAATPPSSINLLSPHYYTPSPATPPDPDSMDAVVAEPEPDSAPKKRRGNPNWVKGHHGGV